MKFKCERHHDRSGQTYWRGEYQTVAGRLILVEADSLKGFSCRFIGIGFATPLLTH